MIYFDNGATTAPYREVVEVQAKVMETYFGNPSSLHTVGSEAGKVLDQSREVAAGQLGVKASEIVFTSGGTESNNAAIKGTAYAYRNRGNHLITTGVEHASVYQVCRQLEARGFDVTYVPVGSDGRVSLEEIERSLRDDTILVSVMHVNNELGAVQPVKEIGSVLKRFPKIVFHVDAVQSFGKVPFDIRGWGIDLLSLSGHKFHGPRGAGVLYVREGLQIEPLLAGGGQEHGLRSGTQHLPGIVALTKAMRMTKENEKDHISHLLKLKRRLVEGIQSEAYAVINSPLDEERSAPHIVNVSFPGIKAEVLLHALEEKDIFVSTRSACSSKPGKGEPRAERGRIE